MMLKSRNLLLFVIAVVGLLVLAACSGPREVVQDLEPLKASFKSTETCSTELNTDCTTTSEEPTKGNKPQSLTTASHELGPCDLGVTDGVTDYVPLATLPVTCIIPVFNSTTERFVYTPDADDDNDNQSDDPNGVPLNPEPDIFFKSVISQGDLRGLGNAESTIVSVAFIPAPDNTLPGVTYRCTNNGTNVAFGGVATVDLLVGGEDENLEDDVDRNGRAPYLSALGFPKIDILDLGPDAGCPNANWTPQLTGFASTENDEGNLEDVRVAVKVDQDGDLITTTDDQVSATFNCGIIPVPDANTAFIPGDTDCVQE